VGHGLCALAHTDAKAGAMAGLRRAHNAFSLQTESEGNGSARPKRSRGLRRPESENAQAEGCECDLKAKLARWRVTGEDGRMVRT
jgi:hypothetical protein